MKDPICGMDVALPSKHASWWNGQEYIFCSAGCKATFDAHPTKYGGQEASLTPPATTDRPNFTPLVLIMSGILMLTVIKYIFTGGRGMMDAMYDFMGVFFVVFGGFKMLDVKGFADAYATYDIIARQSRTYALAYPFIEMVLGVAYLMRWHVGLMNWTTLIIMSIGSVGVAATIAKKQKIRCACLGTKIQLPMTSITLIEDMMMALMALAMLVAG